MRKNIFIILLFLFFLLFTSCSKSQENRMVADDFINAYTSYKESEIFDNVNLYDIKLDDANISEIKNGKIYTFPLLVSFSELSTLERTAEMNIFTDNKNYINSVSITFHESALNLFHSPEHLGIYFSTILASMSQNISLTNATDKILELWNQGGDKRSISVENIFDLNLEYMSGKLTFLIKVQE